MRMRNLPIITIGCFRDSVYCGHSKHLGLQKSGQNRFICSSQHDVRRHALHMLLKTRALPRDRTRQDKKETRQDKNETQRDTRQDKTRDATQGTTRQETTKQNMSRAHKIRQDADNTRKKKTRLDKIRQDKIRQNRARPGTITTSVTVAIAQSKGRYVYACDLSF